MASLDVDWWASRTALVCIAVASAKWQQYVSQNVPGPYLDEVFHVRQAQVYCAGAFSQWDPKITTPPGLYLVSYLVYFATGRCDLGILRFVNVTAICAILLSSFRILRIVRISSRKDASRSGSRNGRSLQSIVFDAHSAMNIALFPPLFFFSGLYYTDVVSTLCVLESYIIFLQSRRPNSSQLESAVKAIPLGIIALSFRQTNIFWIAVFPAGLAVVEVLKDGITATNKEATMKLKPQDALWNSWKQSTLYDCPVNKAGVEDYLMVIVSAGIAALGKALTILRMIVPYVALLIAFGGFVVWNGGVVLGDKSNHVATLHFPQMLYIWPYIFFFSFPLTIPLILTAVSNRLPQGRIRSLLLETHLSVPATLKAPRIMVTVIFMVLATLTVHFNTIIHPFTLADNRHYVFYVFRILRQHPELKYLVVPAYYCCGWLVIHTLGISRQPEIPNHHASSNMSRDQKLKRNAVPAQDPSCQASFVIVWLVTTMLSVITAPLVEPRYFIIPWIMWRLHIPSMAAGGSTTRRAEKSSSNPPSVSQKERPVFWQGYDLRLCLETAWHLAVNIVTTYMFLYRGFAWPQEPGKVQRFMW